MNNPFKLKVLGLGNCTLHRDLAHEDYGTQ